MCIVMHDIVLGTQFVVINLKASTKVSRDNTVSIINI